MKVLSHFRNAGDIQPEQTQDESGRGCQGSVFGMSDTKLLPFTTGRHLQRVNVIVFDWRRRWL